MIQTMRSEKSRFEQRAFSKVTIHKIFVLMNGEFAESAEAVDEVVIPCPMLCWAVVGRLFVINKD